MGCNRYFGISLNSNLPIRLGYPSEEDFLSLGKITASIIGQRLNNFVHALVYQATVRKILAFRVLQSLMQHTPTAFSRSQPEAEPDIQRHQQPPSESRKLKPKPFETLPICFPDSKD